MSSIRGVHSGAQMDKFRRFGLTTPLWFTEANEEDLFVSVMTLGEVRRGIESIRRRDPVSATNLDQWCGMVQARSAGRVPLITLAVADCCEGA